MIGFLRRLRWGGMTLLVGVCLQSCQTTVPELLDAEGAPLRDHDPAAYRLAVAPFEMPPGVEAALRVTGVRRTAAELQGDLVSALNDMDAVSDVLSVDSSDAFDAYGLNADLLLQPRLREARFGREGLTGRAFLSGFLWLTTWFGSLWVEDSRYRATLVVDYDLVDPHTGRLLAQNQSARSKEAHLSFWERNEAFSSGFFISLLVPPFFVGDNRELLGDSLAERANTMVAAQFKGFLLEQLPARQQSLLARVELRSPDNGSRTEAPVAFRWLVTTHGELAEAAVFLNDVLYRTWTAQELTAEGAVEEGMARQVKIELDDVELTRPGRNLVRVLVNVDGLWTSRSVVVYSGEDPPPEPAAESVAAGAAVDGEEGRHDAD